MRQPNSIRDGVFSFPGVELGRILATLAVVAFHIRGMPAHQLTYSGLLYFTITLVIFSYPSPDTAHSIRQFSTKRATRLLVPWLFWWIIYFGLGLAMGKAALADQVSTVSRVLAGPWIALWFLPWAFLASILTYALVSAIRSIRPPVLALLASVATFILFAIVTYIRSHYGIIEPWAQWLHAAPSIPIGIAVACLRRDHGPIAVAGFALPVAIACLFLREEDPGLLLPYAIALIAVTLAIWHTGELPKGLKNASSLCLGVYLTHGLTIALANRTPLVSQLTGAVFVMASALAFTAVYLLRKIHQARWVL